MGKQRLAVDRIDASIDSGLDGSAVSLRQKTGNTNYIKKVVGKSYLSIFMTNILTFFNFLGIFIFVLMIIVGSIENMSFFIIILANTVIGIIQEIRSKRVVEKISLVQQPTVVAMRDGKQVEISTDEIVLDDIIIYTHGKQICADSTVLDGSVEVNEAMLTGESVAVKKNVGDTLFRGSFVVSGSCVSRCEKVAGDNYIEQLTNKVKKFKKPNSQLMKSIKTIIGVISWIIFPLGIATLLTSSENLQTVEGLRQAILKASGSMIGMVPSGMVLLTSVALAVSVIRLVRQKVLVQELYCIEMLARVDTLCLDKTGTITDGTMTVEQVVVLDDKYQDKLNSMIASVVCATKDDNMTAMALARYTNKAGIINASVALPFSSARKYSAATLDGVGTVVIGASEMMNLKVDVEQMSQQYLVKGMRVLTVAVSNKDIVDNKVGNLKAVALLILQDTIRSDAPDIIKWFVDNQVAVKVISGDNPIAVSAIASRVGVDGAERYISLEGMSDEEVAKVATTHTVFGRVSPEQKAILVKAMKANGATVAMTGDGVNDILAMRESDCSVTVACGSDAAKSVAHLVLLDNQFGNMPSVVAEGRRVVNNIQNSSSLFLMKTTMTICTTIMMIFIFLFNRSLAGYPFQPQHLYAIEFFVIGIPSFLFALKPNKNLIKGSFLKNVMRNTLPSGIAMFLSVAMTYAFSGMLALDKTQISTVAMLAMTATGVVALWVLAAPFSLPNIGIASLGTVGTVAFIWVFSMIQSADNPLIVSIDSNAIVFITVLAAVMGGIIVAGKFLIKYLDKRKKVNETVN